MRLVRSFRATGTLNGFLSLERFVSVCFLKSGVFEVSLLLRNANHF